MEIWLGTLPLEKLGARVPQQDLGSDQELALQCSTTARSFCAGTKDAILWISSYWLMFFHPLCSVEKPTYLKLPQTKGKTRNALFNISPDVKSNLNFPELYISWITGCTLLAPSVYMVESLHYQYFNTLLGKNFGRSGGQPPRAL